MLTDWILREEVLKLIQPLANVFGLFFDLVDLNILEFLFHPLALLDLPLIHLLKQANPTLDLVLDLHIPSEINVREVECLLIDNAFVFL